MQRILRVVTVIFIVLLIALFVFRRTRMNMPAATAPPPPQQQQATQSLGDANVYNEHADARQDITGALALAQSTNKNVLMDFGANWCGDCQVLDIYMHDPVNSPLIEKYYIPVHIDVGRMDKNLDLAYTFNVPISKGIPALAVVHSSGRVIFSQTAGQFSNMRAMQSSDLTAFLNKWRPQGK
jgi:thiol:disulfide interchange protein